jgi:hypothetical protein
VSAQNLTFGDVLCTLFVLCYVFETRVD